MAIILPTEKSVPVSDPGQLTTLLYGSPKVGKSTFAAGFPDAIFLSTEPGLNLLSVYKVDVTNWEEFGEAWMQLKKDDRYKTIIIDTVDNLFEFCRIHMLGKLGLVHEHDANDYGRTYQIVRKEFEKAVNALTNSRYGIVFISHAKRDEEKIRGQVINRIYPTVPKQAREYLLGLVDIILYANTEDVVRKEGEEPQPMRVLHTKETEEYEAGDRTGRLPELIPLNYEKYAKCLAKAINGGNNGK